MSDESAFPEPGPVPQGGIPAPPEPERDAVLGLRRSVSLVGLSCLHVRRIGAGELTMMLFHWHAAAPAEKRCRNKLIGYALLFGALMVILRVQYDRPFWRSLGWNPWDAASVDRDCRLGGRAGGGFGRAT